MTKVGDAFVQVSPNTDGFFKKLKRDIEDKWKDTPEEDKPKAKVKPEIDQDAWKKQLADWDKDREKELREGNGLKQKVQLVPDDTLAGRRAFNKALKDLAAKGNRKLEVRVDADTTAAQAKLAALTGHDVFVNVKTRTDDVDRAKLREDIKRRQAALDAMDDAQGNRLEGRAQKVPMQLVMDRLARDEFARGLSQFVDGLKQKLDTDINFRLGMTGLAEINGDLDDFEKRLDKLSKKTVHLDVQLGEDGTATLANLLDGWDEFEWEETGERAYYKEVYIYPKLAKHYDDEGNNEFNRELRSVTRDRELKVQLKPEVDEGFQGMLDALERYDKERDKDRSIKVHAELTGATNLPGMLDALQDLETERTITIRVDVDDAKLEQLKADLKEIKSKHQVEVSVADLKNLPDEDKVTKNVTVDVTVNGKQDLVTLAEQLKILSKLRERQVTVSVVVDGLEQLAALSAALEAAPDVKTVRVEYVEDDPDAAEKMSTVTAVVSGIKDVRALREEIRKLPVSKTVPVKANTGVAKQNVAALRSAIASLPRSKTIPINVNVGAATRAVESLRKKINTLPKDRSLTVNVETTSLDDLVDKIDAARDTWSALKSEMYQGVSERIEVWAEVETAAAEAQLEALTRDRTVRITADVDKDYLRKAEQETLPAREQHDLRTRDAITTMSHDLRKYAEALLENTRRLTTAAESDLTENNTRRVEVADRNIRKFRDAILPDLTLDYQKIDEITSKARTRDHRDISSALTRKHLASLEDKLKSIEEHAAYVVQAERRRGQRRFDQAADMFDAAALGEELLHNKLKGVVRRSNEEPFRNELAWQRALGELASKRMTQERARSQVTDVENVSMDVITDQLSRVHSAMRRSTKVEERSERSIAKLEATIDRNNKLLALGRSGNDELDKLVTELRKDLDWQNRDPHTSAIVRGKRRTLTGAIDPGIEKPIPSSRLYLPGVAERRAPSVSGGKNSTDWAKIGNSLERFSSSWENVAKRAFPPRSYDGRLGGMLKASLRSLFAAPGAAGRGVAGAMMRGGGRAAGAVRTIKLPDGSLLKAVDAVKTPASKASSLGNMGGKAGALPKGAGAAAPVAIVGQGLLTLGKFGMGLGAINNVIGVTTDALAGFSAMVVGAFKPLAQGLQIIAGAPAIFAGLASGIGALVVGMRGLGDAMGNMRDPEKFAEALEELTPNAQAFAKAVKETLPEWDKIRESVQDNLFDGMAESFTRMTDSLYPVLQHQWPSMARSIGDLGDTIMDTIASPRVSQMISSAMSGMTRSFEEMKPGMASFTEGLARMVDVGANELLPSLGRGFSRLGERFNAYFDERRISSWIETGKRGLSEFGGMLGDLTIGIKDFMGGMVAGADASFGEGGVWGAMRNAIKDFREFAASEDGSQKIADFFEGSTDTAREVWSIAKQWGAAIRDDVIPAARDFLEKNGPKIGEMGEKFFSLSSRMADTISPVISAFTTALKLADGVAKRLGFKTPEEKLEAGTQKRANKSEKILDDQFAKGTSRSNPLDAKGKQRLGEELQNNIASNNQWLQDNADAMGTDGWDRVNTAVARSKILFEELRGAFDGARQTADATSAVMQSLGKNIVDIPTSKELHIKEEGTEKAQNALRAIGADVEKLDGHEGVLKVTFPNDMDLMGALQQIRSMMEDMPTAEIKARGLDVIAQQLAEAKAAVDGMAETAEFAIHVDASQLDEVKAKVAELNTPGITEINGSVYIDTNAPEVVAKLEEMRGVKIDEHGQVIIDTNAQEAIAELLGIDVSDVTKLVNVEVNDEALNTIAAEPVQQQVDRVPGEDMTAEEPPAPVDQVVNKVEGVDETNTTAPEPVEQRVDVVMGSNEAQGQIDQLRQPVDTQVSVQLNDNGAQSRLESMKQPVASTLTLNHNVDEVAGKKQQLTNATSSTHTVNSNVGSVLSQVNSLNGKSTTSTHTIRTVKVGAAADGAVVRPMANGGAVQGRNARIAPAGSYILWAEDETGGESYIPWAMSKRARSTKILAETARAFGLSVVDAMGNAVEEGARVTPMAKGGARYGNAASRKLSEEARKRALEQARKRQEERLSPAEMAEAARLEAQLKAVRNSRSQDEETFARKLVGYRNGRFIYGDVPHDAEGAVQAVDRAGLIPENVRILDTIEDWDKVDPRSKGLLRAMDSDKRFDREYRARADRAQTAALGAGLSARDVAMVRAAVDGAMPMSELPPHVQHALINGEKVEQKDSWHRDIDATKLFAAKGDFSEIDWGLVGKYVQGAVGDDLADSIGLKARIQRDVPLYNLLNPDEDTWNALLGDVRSGQQNLEKEYKERYRDEREVMRDARKAEQENQKLRNQSGKHPDALRKELARELQRERDGQMQAAAGMNAVREHRAAMGRQSQGQGVVVNQSIHNINANSAADAANQFRRKTMVGFENLAGVI